jgi:acyl-CoA reductase-like NAD-dependent aldehyde dehydrogenase
LIGRAICQFSDIWHKCALLNWAISSSIWKLCKLKAATEYAGICDCRHVRARDNWLDPGIKEGAKLVVDGRRFKLQRYENGFSIHGCLFDEMTPDMKIYQEEIFGPVLSIVRTRDYNEVVELPSKSLFE